MNEDGCYDAECTVVEFSQKYKNPEIPDLKSPKFPKLQVGMCQTLLILEDLSTDSTEHLESMFDIELQLFARQI
jgi:hypothetical protein